MHHGEVGGSQKDENVILMSPETAPRDVARKLGFVWIWVFLLNLTYFYAFLAILTGTDPLWDWGI